MTKSNPIMMCLRCGYRQKGRGKEWPVDRAHKRRCDFMMAIRYLTPVPTASSP